jgi:hypothetical protein
LTTSLRIHRWAFTFGHVRQLDAVAARFLLALAALLGLRPPPPDAGDSGGFTFVDVDDTIVEVHGHAKQGAGFGYTRVRGLNALIATLTTPGVLRWSWRNDCARVPAGRRAVRNVWSGTP